MILLRRREEIEKCGKSTCQTSLKNMFWCKRQQLGGGVTKSLYA